MDDIQIIALIRRGNSNAFEQVVEQYEMPIIRYLYRLTGDLNMARDLAQDTFLHAYRGILKNDSDISLRPWLYRIAGNNARQVFRRKRVLSFIPFTDFGKQDVPSQEAMSDAVEERMVIEEAMQKIPYEQRKCLLLYFVEGFNYREIAQIVGTSEDAARMRVVRGSRKFREVYIQMSGGDGE